MGDYDRGVDWKLVIRNIRDCGVDGKPVIRNIWDREVGEIGDGGGWKLSDCGDRRCRKCVYDWDGDMLE